MQTSTCIAAGQHLSLGQEAPLIIISLPGMNSQLIATHEWRIVLRIHVRWDLYSLHQLFHKIVPSSLTNSIEVTLLGTSQVTMGWFISVSLVMADAFKMVMNHGRRLHPRNLGLSLDHAKMGPDIFEQEEFRWWLNPATSRGAWDNSRALVSFSSTAWRLTIVNPFN